MNAKQIEIQSDGSMLIRRYRNANCFAVRFAAGTEIKGIVEVGNEFGYDYTPYNETSGEFLNARRTIHIKG